MKSFIVCALLLFNAFVATSQEVFFKSAQSFSDAQLESFYTSITLLDNQIVFNANDYRLYSYDKNTGALKWDYYLKKKSNIPPFLVQGKLWATGNENVVLIDTANGALLKTSNLYTLETAPLVKDNILYGTGIYDGGCIYAYDLQADSIVWRKFLAHGCSRQPFYLAGKIVANGEGDNWLEMNYSGRFTNPNCEDEENNNKESFPSERSCVKQFSTLTHDGIAINGKLAEKMDLQDSETPEIAYGPKNTFVLNQGTLYILKDKLKLKSKTDLFSLADGVEFSDGGKEKILKVSQGQIFVLLDDQLLIYDYNKQKILKTVDLKEWQPHQAIVDENRLWLISSKDGLLYGINI